MSGADITVAIAACGRPDGVARCLAALASQSSPPAEVIVVDQDPSQAARLAVSASGLPGVQYLEQARLGLSASRNLALRSATKTFLAVTDDDCVPDGSWLAALSDALERPPRPGAVTGRILPLGEPSPGGVSISLRDSDAPADYTGRPLPWAVGSGGNFAAPVDVLRAHAGWDERLGTGSRGRAAEDADLIDRLLIGGTLVRYEPAAVVRHEWQTRARRLATRWSYGYGIGAMCGLRLAARDEHGLRMLNGYARLHVRPLFGAIRRGEPHAAAEHARALGALAPGLLYGLSVAARPAAGKTPST